MISTLTGVVSEKLDELVVVDVQGVGYGLIVTSADHGRSATGKSTKFYIYEHIRENAHDLYGFSELDAKKLFEQLLSVKNIGPKAAMAVLDVATPDLVRAGVANGDVKFLQTAKGVGRRAAEQIVVELRDKVGAPVGDAADLGKAIGGLAPDSAGSGTKLGSALDEAAAALRNSDTGLRHVVLFTDGFVDQGQFTKLEADAAALREEGITVSVFGTGEGAARQLQSIATAGGGRFYAGRDLKELPDLLLEETKVVARQLIVEGEFVPERTSNAAIVSRLDAAPVLRGYLATTERPTATVHLRIGEDRDPLLATWQVGLGRTAAWTSDGGTRWAAGWSGWDGAVTFWSDLVRSLAPQPAGEVSMRFGERETMLVATFGDDVPDGATVNATVTSPDGTAQVVTMRRIDQRTFEAEAPTGPAGSYTAAVTAEVRGSAVGSMSAVAERGFSDEFLARSADRDWMQTLSSSTGGRGEIAASAAFERTGTRKGERDLDLRWMMLLLGLIGWIAAIAIGRLRFRTGALAIVRASDRAKAVPGLDAVGARRARAAKDRASAIEGSAERAQATSAPVPPSQPPPPASETPPPTSEPSAESSSLDALLEAKRRRSRGS